MECLVRDREAAKRKYKNVVVDPASLEDIMLFYIKNGIHPLEAPEEQMQNAHEGGNV